MRRHFPSRWARLAWLMPAIAAALTPGCSPSSRSDGSSTGNDGGPETDGADKVSIAFSVPSPLIYVPGDVRTIGVNVTPAGPYSVRFVLVGDPRDAFLDVGEAHTGTDGYAEVNLTAPTSLATFVVRASTGSASAVLDASPGTSFGQVRVVPVYAGTRAVLTWTATVRTGLECATGVPPPDGPLRATSPSGIDLVVDQVPADTPITVTARAGHFAGGCIEIPRIAASLMTDVSVVISDRPLQLDALDLPATLGLDQTQTAIDGWTALATEMATAAAGGATTDASAVLDTMRAGLDPTTAALFDGARTAKGWDTALGTTALGTNQLRARVFDYVLAALPKQGGNFIAGRLKTSTGDTGTLTIGAIAGQSPASVGASDVVYISLSADTNDRALFGGTVTWQPSRLAAALALGPASIDVVGVTSVSDALTNRADCPTVATTLVDVSTGFAFGTCDAACIQTACELAVASLWARAAAADAAPTPMDIAASGSATLLDDSAHPQSFDGTWVGTTTIANASITFSGTAAAGQAP